MEKQIVYGRWIEAETEMGTEIIPFNLVYRTQNQQTLHPKYGDLKDYLEGKELIDWQIVDGYGARLSMPGYLDCTPWVVFETEQEAKDHLE